MIWTECPRCQGEVGDWCGGQCYEGGLYICEACGHAEEEQHEQCPKCGDLDVDVRITRLNEEADEGSPEAAANLFALQSPEPDKVSLQEAFLAGVRSVGEPTVNAELLAALKDILSGWRYIRQDPAHLSIYGVGWDRAQKAAEAAIAKAKGGNQ